MMSDNSINSTVTTDTTVSTIPPTKITYSNCDDIKKSIIDILDKKIEEIKGMLNNKKGGYKKHSSKKSTSKKRSAKRKLTSKKRSAKKHSSKKSISKIHSTKHDQIKIRYKHMI